MKSKFEISWLSGELSLGLGSRLPGDPSIVKDVFRIISLHELPASVEIRIYPVGGMWEPTGLTLETAETNLLNGSAVGVSLWDAAASLQIIVATMDHDNYFDGAYNGKFKIGIDAEVDSSRQRSIFQELCELLRPYVVGYLPKIEGYRVFDVKYALDAALERDGGYVARNDPPEWQWAKQHWHLFPKMHHQGANKFFHPGTCWPERIGWLNCWHPEVCEYLGFPDPDKDAAILPLCEQLPSGHWLVRLTEEPLDVRKPDHLALIAWAYARFDKVGARKKPATPRKKASAQQKSGADKAEHLHSYLIYERDESGNWWQTAFTPIQARNENHALRIFFAEHSKGRLPKPRESLPQLRKAYDEVAMEVELPMSENYQARRKE